MNVGHCIPQEMLEMGEEEEQSNPDEVLQEVAREEDSLEIYESLEIGDDEF